MQMGDDDVLDGVGRDAEIRQRIDRIERELAGTRLRLFGVEAGIDQDVAAAAADQPDEIIEVLRRGLVRIGDQEIQMRGARRHRRIAQRVDFVGISHRCHFFLGCLDLADPGNKPLSSAKVKRGARMTAARQRSTLCETDHIAAPAKRDGARRTITERALDTAFAGMRRHEPGTAEASSADRIRCIDQIASCGSAITEAFIPFIRPVLSRLIVAISDDIASG